MTTTLITGSNTGPGYETARPMAAADHTLYIGARDPEPGRRAAHRPGARSYPARRDRRRLSRGGGLGVLVNNAGIDGRTLDNGVIGAADETAGHMRALFDTNVSGIVRVLHAFLLLPSRGKLPAAGIGVARGAPAGQNPGAGGPGATGGPQEHTVRRPERCE